VLAREHTVNSSDSPRPEGTSDDINRSSDYNAGQLESPQLHLQRYQNPFFCLRNDFIFVAAFSVGHGCIAMMNR